jgi:putative DNA primase/helicase
VVLVETVKSVLKQVYESDRYDMCYTRGSVFIYNGAYWGRIADADFMNFLGKCAERLGCSRYKSDHYEFKAKLLKQFMSTAHLPEPVPDNSKVLINLLNGTVEVTKDGVECREFDRNDFLCYQLGFEWDPAAKCPKFDKYLGEVLPEAELQAVLQEFVASVFFKSWHHEKALFLFGSGGNGKSVFYNIIRAMLGEDQVCAYTLTDLGKEYTRTQVVGKLLNYSSEISKKGVDSGVFKALVSREGLLCREPFKTPYESSDWPRMAFNVNELPTNNSEQTKAFYRRFCIVPFNYEVSDSEKIHDLDQQIIREEMAGVFNWVCKGIDRLVNMSEPTFTKSKVINEQVEEFQRQADSVLSFMKEERYVKYKDPAWTVKDLYVQYTTNCINWGLKPVGKNQFTARLRSAGYKVEGATGNVMSVWCIHSVDPTPPRE